MKLRHLPYYLKYGLQCFILGQKRPLVAGIAITDTCNLHCAHCVVNNLGRGHESFANITQWISDFYNKGARFLYLQGGEPMCWSEGNKDVNDIINYAKQLGFHKVAMASNGTMPLDVQSDFIWISIDGLPETHNSIRKQDIFYKIEENIAKSTCKLIYANMAVNTINVQEVENVIKYIASSNHFNGISINFHTPYPGVEHLCLPLAERSVVVNKVIALKKSGYPVINSKAALQALGSGNYKRPSEMIEMIDHGVLYQCCFGKDPKVCAQCGYGIIAELSCISRFQLPAITEALSLFK